MSGWISTWGQATTEISMIRPSYNNRTMNLAVVNNIKGDKIRIRLSNRDGKKSMHIIEGTIAVNGQEQKKLLFNGEAELIIKSGMETYSDVVSMEIDTGDYITINLAFDGPVTSGNNIVETIHCSENGNFTKATQFKTVHRDKTACYHDMAQAIPALSSIEVFSEEEGCAIVCFGDSITQQSNWTKPLAEKMAELYPGKVSVINKGIGGNRLLNGPSPSFMGMYGQAGIQRFDRDVLDEAGVKAVVFALGTNDLGMSRNPKKPGWITAQMLIDAYVELVANAKENGLKVYGTTILPRAGSDGYTSSHETERIKFNEWMRTTDIFDKVFDFDEAVRNPIDLDKMRMEYDSGDHLHPGVLGGKKMAECIWKESEVFV